MNDNNFKALLTSGSKFNNFKIRRTLERLREGLFDPFGVQLLTTGSKKLDQIFIDAVEKNHKHSSHLCICGAYGQGKSHTLKYIGQQALDQNFVISYINIDPVQVCFHNFNIVYRALMENLCFPDSDDSFIKIWKTRAKLWLSKTENRDRTLKDLIPKTIPHRFQCILTAMAQNNMVIPKKKRKLKKHARFQPGAFPWILKSALLGKNTPAWRLSSVFKYREVDFYKKRSLVCKTSDEYLDMVQGMGRLFKKIGYSGWVILFDEGEAIAQNNILCRSKSYRLLDKIFYPETESKGLFSVFAFTNEFFTRLEHEDYDRIKPRSRCKTTKQTSNHQPGNSVENQQLYFDKNYYQEWKNLKKFILHDLSSKQWDILIKRVVIIHALAYRWEPSMDLIKPKIYSKLLQHQAVETRLKLKLIVDILDMEQQKLQFIIHHRL